jgi:hypothetical protein
VIAVKITWLPGHTVSSGVVTIIVAVAIVFTIIVTGLDKATLFAAHGILGVNMHTITSPDTGA